MKIVAMIGDNPRHFAVAQSLYRTGQLKLLIVEKREPRLPEPPAALSEQLKALFVRHFRERDEVERAFFPPSAQAMPDVRRVSITADELNGDGVFRLLREQDPDLLISFGVHKLTAKTLSAVRGRKWNTHGGLSPRYRGCITHFWPTYLLEPQMTGMTVHELTEQLDAGDIIHQSAAPLVRGDGVHHTACRAVQSLVDEWPMLIELLHKQEIAPAVPQKTKGKLWVASDWRPEHLRVVYELYGNRVVDAYLNGHLEQGKPTLVRQGR